MTDSFTPRRGFLGRAAATLASLVALPSLAGSQSQQGSTDEAWLQGLNGKHKQIFDVATIREGTPMARTANFMDVYAEAYGMKDTDLSVVVGLHSAATALAFNDAMWAKYELGKRTNENDPRTQALAVRNVFASGTPTSIARLQERGVRFVVCMRAIRRLSGQLATPGTTADQVRAELLANLLPGVTPVPAMIVAVNRAQEAGLTYAYIG
jgi:intracellular sulfur oxidation DsrE/DsrF family protein